VAVAERQLFLVEDPRERVRVALEIGALWRDRLGDMPRAMAAFERAMEYVEDSDERQRLMLCCAPQLRRAP
jgi:hypothetical protein